MSTQTLDYLDAIAHLPAGGTLILTDVPWEEYEQLLEDVGDWPGVRICYNQGRLEIMSPSSEHENFKELISQLGRILADETGVVLESLGSTTYKQKWLKRGVEPDCCFYIQNAASIIGRHPIDLMTDPPPDIAVEVDISHESLSKLAIYAGMGVPELWRYDGQRVYIYRLLEQQYVEVSVSHTFPLITGEVLCQFLEQSWTEGQTAALKSFRDWLRAQQ
jgi:Uma2 family endonuclease